MKRPCKAQLSQSTTAHADTLKERTDVWPLCAEVDLRFNHHTRTDYLDPYSPLTSLSITLASQPIPLRRLAQHHAPAPNTT